MWERGRVKGGKAWRNKPGGWRALLKVRVSDPAAAGVVPPVCRRRLRAVLPWRGYVLVCRARMTGALCLFALSAEARLLLTCVRVCESADEGSACPART